MAKFPIGRGSQTGRTTQSRNTGNAPRGTIDVNALTKKARYIVDETGRRHAVVVDYATWRNFLRQVDESGAASGSVYTSTGSSNTGSSNISEAEYTLRHDHANGDLYRPQPARGKEAADFTLETNVTRRGG